MLLGDIFWLFAFFVDFICILAMKKHDSILTHVVAVKSLHFIDDKIFCFCRMLNGMIN